MGKKVNLSVVLATFNEEENIARCLTSVTSWADEIVVVDGGSTDRTQAIAASYGARVIRTDNPPIFHINKQKAVDAATGKWVLQLDADEEVPPALAEEIQSIITMSSDEVGKRNIESQKARLFHRHQTLVQERDGKIGTERGDYVAFYVPRRNYFLGYPMRYAGTYPDGVIRLIQKRYARFPQKSVHEQINVDGRVGWLVHDLIHRSNTTLRKYFIAADQYTDLLANRLIEKNTRFSIKNIWFYNFAKPLSTFTDLFIRHKGVFDGWYGFLFSLFSSLHYPVAYFKCLRVKTN